MVEYLCACSVWFTSICNVFWWSLSIMPCLHLIENDIVHWPFVQNLNTFRHGNEFAPTVGFFLTTHPSEVLLPIGLKHVYWLQRGYLYRVFFIGLKCILFFELLTVHHLYAKKNCPFFIYLGWTVELINKSTRLWLVFLLLCFDRRYQIR